MSKSISELSFLWNSETGEYAVFPHPTNPDIYNYYDCSLGAGWWEASADQATRERHLTEIFEHLVKEIGVDSSELNLFLLINISEWGPLVERLIQED